MASRDRGHPVIAAMYEPIQRLLDALGLARQRRRVGRAASGRVLEIGAGTGAMLPHYGPSVTEVVATDVDPHMLARLRRRAARASVPVAVQRVDAETLPFDAASFDTVVVTLSLCTIPDPGAALDEIARVLRPDGRLVFLEHVRSGRPVVARLQSAATPIWRVLAGGCHLDRDTEAAIRGTGLEVTHLWRSGRGRGSMIQGEAVRRQQESGATPKWSGDRQVG